MRVFRTATGWTGWRLVCGGRGRRGRRGGGERFPRAGAFGVRWRAAGGLAVDADAFHPTVLVGVGSRLRRSGRRRRLFEDVNAVARRAGLLRGAKRVIVSTLCGPVAP